MAGFIHYLWQQRTSMEHPGTDIFIADKLQSPDVANRAAQTLAGQRRPWQDPVEGISRERAVGQLLYWKRDFPRGPLDMFFCWKVFVLGTRRNSFLGEDGSAEGVWRHFCKHRFGWE
jgi:hypothetical protein